MTTYLDYERKERIKGLEQELDKYHSFIEREGFSLERLSLRELREIYGKKWVESIKAVGPCAVTVTENILSLFNRIHNTILAWKLEVDEDVTVSEFFDVAKSYLEEKLYAKELKEKKGGPLPGVGL